MKVEEKIQEIDEKLDAIIRYFGISGRPGRSVIELRKEAARIIEMRKNKPEDRNGGQTEN